RQGSERTGSARGRQHRDNAITTGTKRGKRGSRGDASKQGHGEPNPTGSPSGNQGTRRSAAKSDGGAGGTG
ncbi:cholesterol oxidase, partial [Mycobacterium tuberculosis]